MNITRYQGIFLLISTAVLGFLVFLVLKPYLNYIIFSAILVFVSFPLYKKLKSRIRSSHLSAIILIISMLVLIITPSIFLTFQLFQQARDIFFPLQTYSEEIIPEEIYSLTGIDIRENIKSISANIVSYALTNIFTLTKTFAKISVGIFILLFSMFYLYIDGEKIAERVKKLIPLNKKYQDYLVNHTYQVTQGLLIGIFLTAMIQGLLGGIGFFLFGIPNVIFWGFVMALLSMIPFLGPHFVYVPAALFLMYKGNIGAGIGLLIFGIIIVSNLDNIIRPRIVRFRVKIHPLIVILGMIGGISLMGIVGMILGPLVIALFIELVEEYNLIKRRK